MKNIVLSLVLLFALSCSENPDEMLPFINGYWEISEVKKDNKIIKSYTISTSVDYFQVNDDNSGFRKKVMPTLEGNYIVSEHKTPFILKIDHNTLTIQYTNGLETFSETIIRASKETLVITNDEGFTYSYKPFKELDLNL